MDADQLRLILLAAGAALVVAIYSWDRYKSSRHRLRSMPRTSRGSAPTTLGDAQEPGEVPSMRLSEDEISPPLQLTEADTVLLDDEPELQPELDFGVGDNTDYLHGADPDLEKVPKLVVQIAVVRSDRMLNGDELQKAMAEVGLKPGDMDIYHRYDEHRRNQVWFSVANLVEPGTFPFEDMAQFSTPGLLMFTQLPGVRDGMMIYAEMLFAAERLAGLLGASLQDESRSSLSKQAIEHTKEMILEHRRKVQLARKK